MRFDAALLALLHFVAMSVREPSRSARVLTVLNLKGGVGKTHTAWLLAAVAEERQRRILVIDTDTQCNFSSSFLSLPDGRAGLEVVFDPAAELEVASLIRRTDYPHIDVLPATPSLSRFDLSDQQTWEKADLHLALAHGLAGVRNSYDLIVIDCPPRLSLASFASLCASDAVLIPLEAADWGAQGIVQVKTATDYVRRKFQPNLALLGYLVSQFKPRRSFQQAYLSRLRTHFGDLAFDTIVPDLAEFEKSVATRIPITRYAPRSRAAGIARALFDEVERRFVALESVRGQGSRSSLHHTNVGVAG